MKKKRLTKNQKVNIVMQSPEVVSAVRILLACMNDIEAKNFISGDFIFQKKAIHLLITQRDFNPKQ